MTAPTRATGLSLGVVIITRDRATTLLGTLERLRAEKDVTEIVVVDQGSADTTVDDVRSVRDERIRVVALTSNRGAAGRNIGALALRTDLMAFCDDDSWFETGSLTRAAEHFGRHPGLGLLAAQVVVEPHGRADETTEVMRRSVLGTRPGMPGPDILGFLACGAVLRRSAFLGVGGFEPRLGIGGEETLLAVDLAAAGWQVVLGSDVVAHHAPSGEHRPERRRTAARNDLWTDWLRGSPSTVRISTLDALRAASGDAVIAAGIVEAFVGLPHIIRGRRQLPQRLTERLEAIRRADG